MMKNNLNLHSAIIEDASLQGTMQNWVEMECNQLSAGNIVAEVDFLEFDTLKIVRASQIATIQKTGITGANFCGIAYTTIDPSFRFLHRTVETPETLFFLPELTEYDVIVPAGVHTAYVALDQEKLINNARILNPKQWEHDPKGLITFNSSQQAMLKLTIDSLCNIAEQPNTVTNRLEQFFLKKNLLENVFQIVTSGHVDTNPSYSSCLSSFQTYQKARAYIEDQLNINVTPTIVSICDVTGSSERAVQYAFRAHVNMTPIVYLRLRRLNRVRTLLLVSDPQKTTITQIAMSFGFLHLGRFSLDYKRMFNESPSVTFNR